MLILSKMTSFLHIHGTKYTLDLGNRVMSLGQTLYRGKGERKGRTVRGGRRGKEKERLGAEGEGGKGERREEKLHAFINM